MIQSKKKSVLRQGMIFIRLGIDDNSIGKLKHPWFKRSWFWLFILISSISCIERYEGEFPSSQTQFLVVDAQVSNKTCNSFVRLTVSRSINETIANPNDENDELVREATVSIIENENNELVFIEEEPGLYMPINENFQGSIGSSYQLRVILSNGKRIISEIELLPEPVEISDVNYRPDTVFRVTPFNTINTQRGSRIKAMIDVTERKNLFYRLYWDATYEINAFLNDTDVDLLRCWVDFSRRDELFIGSIPSSGPLSDLVEMHFVPPFQTLFGYYITVEAYSIPERIYRYWEQVKSQQEAQGNIFDPIPFPVRGNLLNPDDPNEIIIGSFRPFSVTAKSFYYRYVLQQYIICYDPDIEFENLPGYCFDCTQFPGATNVKPSFWPN
jgi:hypothetical protein